VTATAPARSPATATEQRPGPIQLASATLLVCGPLAGFAWALARLPAHPFTWLDAGLLVGGYVLTGLGVTIGLHRHLAHRAFKLARPLRIAVLVAATMSIQGSPLTWVGQHRKHHAYAEGDGDPHSPYRFGPGVWPMTKGFVYAHIGWFFQANPVDPRRWTPELLSDPDVVCISRAALPLGIASLLTPLAIGLAVTGTLEGGLSALLWGGLVRVGLLHHVTFCTNSVCHVVGRRPFATPDRSTNVALLALLSFGESWHNGHHAFPASARHGLVPGQLDPSATLIAVFERLGWATSVRRPDPDRVLRKMYR
jgi:stearoyl-CoA desaturase (delta-9 desaturase)